MHISNPNLLKTLLATTVLAYAATAAHAQTPAPAAAAPAPAAAAAPAVGAAPLVTADRLLNTDKEPQNWLTYHRDYSGHRFSPLDQINVSNVANMHVAFTFPVGGIDGAAAFSHAALEATPLVNEGFLYTTNGWGNVFKVNVKNGYAQPVWKFDPGTDKAWAASVTCCDIDNRGVALWQDKVVSHVLDGRLEVINDAGGDLAWERRMADPDKGEVLTAAPLVVKDLAITGMAGAEKGVRGWLAATNLTTHQEAWRTYTIPAPGEPGSETWTDSHNAWKTGGASTWGNGTYDPALNLIYWGTANPGPDFDPEYRPGRNLFADSLLALDVDTGKMKWYFQYTPNDAYDHDEIGEAPLVNVSINGQPRTIVVHAGRNGLFYGFDRVNGQFLYGGKFLDKVTWTKGLDPKTGLPVEFDPSQQVQTYVSEVTGLRAKPPTAPLCPSTGGGKNWQPTAYNPTLQRLYIPAMESCGQIFAQAQEPPVAEGGKWALPTSFTGAGAGTVQLSLTGSITAVSVLDGAIVKKVNTPYPMWGGMLATGGGLIFTSTLDGFVKAYDANTLQELWKFNVGSGINAPPMSYSVGGKQYVAIMVGSFVGAAYRGNQPAQVGMEAQSTMYVFSL